MRITIVKAPDPWVPTPPPPPIWPGDGFDPMTENEEWSAYGDPTALEYHEEFNECV